MILGILAHGEIIHLDDLVQKINRYSNYFKASNGGVTVSGGEPLLQADFLIALMKELKKLHIHVAIDTSGMVALTPKIKEVIHLCDLFLLDIKHINSEKCKDLVGFSNEKELSFAKYLSENNKPIWIRQVIIPGITDNKEDLEKLKDFISSLKTVEKVELLKYHDMGKFKWDKLSAKYELDHIRPANDDDITKSKEILGLT